MSPQHPPTHVHGVGQHPPPQHFGIYLGKVTNTRPQDIWVRLKVPQVLGNTVSDWARPMGFDAIGVSGLSTPWETVDGDPGGPGHTHHVVISYSGTISGGGGGTYAGSSSGDTGENNPNNEQAYHTGEKIRLPDPAGGFVNSLVWGYVGSHPPPHGPGPGVGTLVLVMFLGGDIRLPIWTFTTQNVYGSGLYGT